MIFEYQRLLSEAWYANQMFWVSNFIIQVIAFFIQIDAYIKTPSMMAIRMIGVFANLSLVVLMLKTEKRTLQNRRPEYDMLGTPKGMKRALM
jgi:membrane protein YdbS with pleckstrin-like domain